MGYVFLHQISDNFHSLRFQISVLVLALFFGANGVVYNWKIRHDAREIAQMESENRQRYDNAKTVGQAADNWYRITAHPLHTEFIAEGGYDKLGDTCWLNVERGMGGMGKVLSTNNWMRNFEVVDWTLITRIVLSFLAIVLAYDAISGELESGTLRLALANPIARGWYLAGRFLAHWVTLVAATLLGMMISLLILSFGGSFMFTGRVIRGIGLFFLGTVWYIALFLLIAMGVSALAKSSASSLVLLLLAWAVLIVIIPQSSYLVASKVVDIPAADAVWQRRHALETDLSKRLQERGITQRGLELGRADGYAMEKEYARLRRETEREKERIILESRRQELRQFAVARGVSLISPGFAFQFSVEAALGTGVMRLEHFFRQARRYRHVLREFVRARDAADRDSPHILFLARYMSQKELDPREIPRFKENPLSVGEGVQAGRVPIAILVIETALAFFFAFWVFNRLQIA